MAALAIVLGLGSTGRAPAWLVPRTAASSVWFLALTAYLCAALVASIVLRVRTWARLRRLGHVSSERFRVERTLVMAGAGATAEARLREAVAAQGYAPRGAAAGILRASRGDLGFAGSIAFHAGLLLVLGGVAVSSLTRLGGELLLAEGHPAALEAASFVTLDGAGRLPAPDGTRVGIRDFIAEYSESGTPVDFAAVMTFERPGAPPRERLVRVNQGATFAGLQFTLQRYGFAPALEAVDERGRTRLDAVGLLSLLPPGREDSLPLEGGGTLRVSLYPDHARGGGRSVSRSLRPARPVLHFAWVEPGGRVAAEGEVAEGASVTVGGRTVRFERLAYFAGVVVARDRGLWLLIAGSLFGALGLGLRLAYPDQSLRAEWEPCAEGTRVRLTASTRFFPAMYEQTVERLVAALREDATPA